MPLTVETGAGVANAESYISVADANAYHNARGNTTWLTITNQQAEEALRRATDYMQQIYYGLWHGYKSNRDQALDWPRRYVPRIDQWGYYDSAFIPQEIKNACAELAWKAAKGELAPDLTQTVKREKIDVLEVEYSENSPQYPRYRAIDNLLSRFMSQSVGSAIRRVVRV